MGNLLSGELSIIGMKGCEDFTRQVDVYLREWRCREGEDRTFIVRSECPRFGTGEAKGLIYETLRGRDVYIISDMFNYGVTFKMYGMTVPMSPDDHFQDLKRIIGAIGGKAKRITVIMPMLYEGRQHRRAARESLDCAQALHELVNMGVANIITFDAHDARVQNAIPLSGFENVHPTYQMLKALLRCYQDISLHPDDLMIISPDEGAMSRCIYYSSVLGLDLGMFYKRRDYTRVVDGRNPIEAHEYLGREVRGKDVIVVEDIISTGESMIDVCRQLKAKGAARVFVFCSFGLFCNGPEAFDRAYAEGVFTKVFTTNLIYRTPELKRRSWYEEVNMCKYVSLIIDTLNYDNSLSELLNPVSRINKLVERYKAEHANIQMRLDQPI